MPFRKNGGSLFGKAMLAALVSATLLQTPAIEARVLSGSITERKQNKKIDTMLKSAQKNYDSGKVQSAIDTYWKILELDPLETFAYLELGEVYVNLRIYDRAIELLDPGLKMAEREMDRDTICHYFCVLTNAHLALNQTGLANKTLIKAAEAAPRNPMPRKILGDIYLANNRIADAMKAYHKAIELDPEYQPAKEKLGELIAKYGDQLPAKTRNKKVIRDKAVKLPPAEAKQVQAGKTAEKQESTAAAQTKATALTESVTRPLTASATISANSDNQPPISLPVVSSVKPELPASGAASSKDLPAKKLAPDTITASPTTLIVTASKPLPAVEPAPRPMPVAANAGTASIKNAKPSTVAATNSIATSTPISAQPSTAVPTASSTEIETQLEKFLAGTPEEKKVAVNFFVRLEEKGLTEMEELLYDPDPEVRVLAIRALPEFKAFTQRVKTMLNDASEDPDPLVVEEINKALQNL